MLMLFLLLLDDDDDDDADDCGNDDDLGVSVNSGVRGAMLGVVGWLFRDKSRRDNDRR